MSNTAGQDTVIASAIPRLIRWLGRFFVGRSSSAGHRDRAIESAAAVPPSGTLQKFSCPLCLILSSHVFTAAVLVVPHICFRPYPPSPLSSCISFVVPIVSPLCHISAASVSIASCLRRCLCFHPYPPSLSSSVSDYAVLVNLRLSCHSHPPPSPPSGISPSAILIILRLCRVSSVAVSAVLRLYHCRAPLLRPCCVPPSHYY